MILKLLYLINYLVDHIKKRLDCCNYEKYAICNPMSCNGELDISNCMMNLGRNERKKERLCNTIST